MGGLTDDGKGSQVAYVGGEPKSNVWKDGRSPKSSSKSPEMNQRRPQDTRGGTLMEAALKEALSPKFNPDTGEDFVGFCRRFFVRLQDHGQDTITYVENHGKMESLLLNLHCMSEEAVNTLVSNRVPDYDCFDHQNDRTAMKALHASLTPDLERRALDKCLQMRQRGGW
jgi:hypothetical protein